jgi:lipopolysaccharide/colanic/teichoic acid biosynthesis glycosyltransferase
MRGLSFFGKRALHAASKFSATSRRRPGSMSATMSIRTTNGSILRPGWKSALDITCILLSLPVWLPLMILLMLVTRIASRGPIFYRQKRIGLGGRPFFIWKFRTMNLSAETQIHERYFHELMQVDCPMTKLDACGDPRLAPFGRILRASGLDELPQIFNVLCGEMSLVGPRPCLPNEFAHYEPWQRERVNGLPGLTGYWQVNGKNKTTFNQMIAMDLFYLKNMSILLDLKIMLKTCAVIAGQLFESQQAAQRSRQNGSRRSPTTTIPSLFLLPVSTAAAQLQSWLLEKASSVGYLVRSLCSRVEHAAVALVSLLLGLCQQGKISQQAVDLAGQAEKAVATSLVATSFVAPALAETTDFGFDLKGASPATSNTRKGKVASRAIVKRSPRRVRPQYQVGPALRVEKTIYHEWRRLVAARKSVHSAFARLIRDAHPQQSKQKHRKQRRS